MSEHEHAWQLALHIDTCHSYGSTYGCECGATRATVSERDFLDQFSMSSIWALADCERCQQLLAGDEPTHFDKVYEKGEA